LETTKALQRLVPHPLRYAKFLAHSLSPDEQRRVFGQTPWFFRKLLLRRGFDRLQPFAVNANVDV